MSNEKKVSVYIVDDHPIVRLGLAAMINEHPQMHLAGHAGDAATALQEITTLQPEVVLVDLRLPVMDGCALCQKLKLLPQAPRVLVLTSFGEDNNVLAAVGSGADGFVVKNCQADVLLGAITVVAAGGTVWPSFATATARSNRKAVSGKCLNKLDLLSPQERRVLALVAEGKTNKEIGVTMGTTDNTIRNQVSHLMSKLEVDRRAQAAAYYVKYSAQAVG